MKALIYILAILLMAAGIAVGLVSVLSPGQVVLGLDLHLGGSLFAGGVVALGLAGVITALDGVRKHLARLTKASAGPAGGGGAKRDNVAASAKPAKPAADLAPEAVAGVAAVAAAKTPSSDADQPSQAEVAEIAAVAGARETSTGLREETDKDGAEEEAAEAEDKGDKTAIAKEAEAEPEKAAEPEEADEAGAEDAEAEISEEEFEVGDLYVVEERTIHGRPARLLSDGTVEAETDEGWMRFENLEHLEEYTAAVEKAQ